MRILTRCGLKARLTGPSGRRAPIVVAHRLGAAKGLGERLRRVDPRLEVRDLRGLRGQSCGRALSEVFRVFQSVLGKC